MVPGEYFGWLLKFKLDSLESTGDKRPSHNTSNRLLPLSSLLPQGGSGRTLLPPVGPKKNKVNSNAVVIAQNKNLTMNNVFQSCVNINNVVYWEFRAG